MPQSCVRERTAGVDHIHEGIVVAVAVNPHVIAPGQRVRNGKGLVAVGIVAEIEARRPRTRTRHVIGDQPLAVEFVEIPLEIAVVAEDDLLVDVRIGGLFEIVFARSQKQGSQRAHTPCDIPECIQFFHLFGLLHS